MWDEHKSESRSSSCRIHVELRSGIQPMCVLTNPAIQVNLFKLNPPLEMVPNLFNI